MTRVSANVDLNESACNEKQKRNHNYIRCKCKELDDWGFYKNDYLWNRNTYNCDFNQACKIDEYLDIKKCFCKKRLFGKLLLECIDEILNTAETLLNDENEIFWKSNCLIHTTSFAIICLLLLVVIYVSFCFYYTKYLPKQKYLLPFNNTINKSGEIRY